MSDDIAYAHEARPDEATFSHAFCTACSATRQHLDGRCTMRANHLRPCRDCGRPCTGGLCSACESVRDLSHELDGPADEDWHRGDR